uniref:Uncharacterized protein n=1 Tax=Macaca fascicularis TaxID=9541 RepID=A0A7N9C8T0_MACFA
SGIHVQNVQVCYIDNLLPCCAQNPVTSSSPFNITFTSV